MSNTAPAAVSVVASASSAASSAAQKLGEDIRQRFSAAFSAESSPTKHGKLENGKRELSPSSRMPFTQPQASWLQAALGDVITVFGEHVSGRVLAVEERMDSLEAVSATTTGRLHELDSMRTQMETMAKDIKAVQGAQTDLGTQMLTAPSLASTAASASSSTPYEARKIARIGNLGWNDTAETILKRANEVLRDAGAQPNEYTNLVPTSRTSGSAAELLFQSATRLQEMKLAIKSLGRAYTDERIVWMDAKKERHELRPARLVHRVFEAIQDLESTREDKMEAEKIMNGKFIKVGGTRAGYSFNSTWKWTAFAVARYTAEQLDVAKAYAEED